MLPTMALNEEMWRAIVNNDASYNGRFYYAVRTTGIFCRPSCGSRQPNRSHVELFATAGQALAAGYRPCKRCGPADQRQPDEEWAQQAAGWLDAHYMEPVTLEVLSAALHRSIYHLQRTFKRIIGMTPAEYLTRLRIEQAKQLLTDSSLPVADVGQAVGLPNPAHFSALFQRRTGMPPTEYRRERKEQDHETK
ncbi:bifunctional transcriptional activator/DNA repair enzyme AdaA [Paenibacillus protaetiae]|uniref:Methylphosphotriester-DNA--protein-cysteine methyltransferase family protein n=1 Tax=Paenibacillus protaetiae TaxID=2509456 RepID=A0A4P6F0J9_9BACL|nr:bifunctional transcriptional activator/DNA repair enzyme AdaA [Paenibacillus protaetiae]QAY67619.1 methylphosphotriester-DNA--protein-cysteine methyltransferase family protein [Paenibacillus protaetiae]